MTLLPIARRELLAAARRPATYWGRFSFALIGVLAVGGVLVALSYGVRMRSPGRELFQAFTGFGMFYCMFVGAMRMCDCLSVEKREGTLGFLFLTNLKGHDIVFGKLMAGMTEAVCGLMSVFPLLSVLLLLGGVELGDVARACLAMLNAMWFSSALGVLISSMSRNQQHASTTASFAALFFIWGVPGIVEYLKHTQTFRETGEWLALVTPVSALESVATTGIGPARTGYWSAMAVSHLMGWCAVGLASWIIPRTWQDRPPSGRNRIPIAQRWRQWTFGSGPERVLRRRHMLGINPFYWLTHRDRWKAWWPWLGMGLSGGLICLIVLAVNRWRFDPLMLLLTSAAWYLTVKLGVAGGASSRLAEEKAGGSLELLLSTPLTPLDISRGQWLSLKRQFLHPAAATMLLIMATTAVQATHEPLMARDERLNVLLTGAACLLMLVVDLFALGWAGMWQGIAAKDAKQASTSAYTHIMVLPNLIFVVWMWAVMMYFGWQRMRTPEFPFFLASWTLIGVVNSVVQFFTCRHLFLANMRELAVSRFQPAVPSLWGKLGRMLGLFVARRFRK